MSRSFRSVRRLATVLILGISAFFATSTVAVLPAAAAPKAAKYYFRLDEVKAEDAKLAAVAKELLAKELESRPEFTSEIGNAGDGESLVAELKRRKLDGFNVSLRIDKAATELQPPRPGGRLKQLGVAVKLSVFGATLPGEKLAFSGDGEAEMAGEVIERRLEEERATLLRDALERALKQAVDQAVLKLSLPKSGPKSDAKKRRKT